MQDHVLLCLDCARKFGSVEQPSIGVLYGKCKRCGRPVGHVHGIGYALIPFNVVSKEITLSSNLEEVVEHKS